MVLNINYLLIGNTRFHWAKKIQDRYVFYHTFTNEQLPKDINLENLIWASVGKFTSKALKKENEIKTKDIPYISIPNHFGVDRALGSLYAAQKIDNPFKKDLLIADCGTTLSLTKLTSKGEIIGGQILPGFFTQLNAMQQNTKHLKLPKKFEIPKENFSIKTEKAMLKGVLNSLIGAIKMSFDPKNDILIICGGDAELISKSFNKIDQTIILKKNLVMLGMILYYEY